MKIAKSKHYHYSDFTEKSYSKILSMAKKYYSFEDFGTKSKEPHIILRHDLDYSVHRALKLAKIEKNLGIRSTYFLRLHSEMYNLFEKSISEKIKNIHQLGHNLGIHFEYSYYDEISSLQELTKKICLEKNILESQFGNLFQVFSFHNPDTSNAINIDKNSIAGMINTYGKEIKSNYHYCSDSNGYWRFVRLPDIIKNKKYDKLHILIHPEWWQKKPLSPKDRIKRCIEQRAKTTLNLYEKITKDGGRKNIG